MAPYRLAGHRLHERRRQLQFSTAPVSQHGELQVVLRQSGLVARSLDRTCCRMLGEGGTARRASVCDAVVGPAEAYARSRPRSAGTGNASRSGLLARHSALAARHGCACFSRSDGDSENVPAECYVELEFDYSVENDTGREACSAAAWEGRGARGEFRAPANEVVGLHHLRYGPADLDYEAEFCEDEVDEGPFESLLRHAPEIEAGLIPGWKLDRSMSGASCGPPRRGDSTSHRLTAARTYRTGIKRLAVGSCVVKTFECRDHLKSG